MSMFAKLNTRKHVSLLKLHVKCAQSVFYSAALPQPEVKEKPLMTPAESFEALIRMIPRTKKEKKPKREPFIKNLVIGKYDREVLIYPEIEKEELQELNKNLEPVQRYFSQVGSEDTYRKLSEELVENMGNMKLFGLQVPKTSGGLELTLTEQCR